MQISRSSDWRPYFDDLMVDVRKHLAEAAYAAHTTPIEIFLLAMLIEEHKEVMKMRQGIEYHESGNDSDINKAQTVAS